MNIYLPAFEKYFLQTSEFASLTILLTECAGETTATLIGSGGRCGVFNFSYGTNATVVFAAQKELETQGLAVVSEHSN